MALPAQPNIVIFMTDQQRALQYFPAAWVEANLGNLNQLSNSGLTFVNAITNASRCSPSRGVLNTGLYAPANGLVDVGGTLNKEWTTLSAYLAQAGYQSGYVGKWHMQSSFVAPANVLPPDSSTMAQETQLMATDYGIAGWDAPDAGTALGWNYSPRPTQPPTPADRYTSTSNSLGGGPKSLNHNDCRIADDAIAFLGTVSTATPFALVVSLVNPHDVWADLYLRLQEQAFPEFPAAFDALAHADEFVLPESYSADNLSTKPAIQAATRAKYTATWAQSRKVDPPTQLGPADALTYLKFYAYLTYLADQQLGRVYTALQQLPQFDDTLVLRLADHGELGMSHGGSMEKDCNVYAETISIPYIFSNPQMYASAQTCSAQAGLVDVLPTLLGLIGASVPAGLQGSDLSALLSNPGATPTVNCSLFTYDDDTSVHIRAIQAAPGAVSVGSQPTGSAYKYAVYYAFGNDGKVDPGSLQYELYIPGADGEIENLQPANTALQAALHTLLTQRMNALDSSRPALANAITPPGWPATPP